MWPWIFERSDKPARVISTIEALAVLMGLKLFYGDEAQSAHTRIQMIPSFTDNRGNGSALNKLMTSKYPSSAVVMELACYLKRMSIKAVVDWAPRTANYEADELANGNTSRFDPAKRITFEESEVRWDILPEALQEGREMESERQRALAGGPVAQTEHARSESESWRTDCACGILGNPLCKGTPPSAQSLTIQ